MKKVLLILKTKPVYLWMTIGLLLLIFYFPLEGRFADIKSELETNNKLSKLVEKDAMYVDEKKILGASTDQKIYVVVKTLENAYILAEVNDAKIESGVFSR